jgi:hypothetical protein
MEINTENMVNNELRKAALLMLKACEMNMDLTSYGEVAVNEHNGNVYLWVEDYPFTLYIPLGERNTIYALWTNTENGDEVQTPVHGKNLDRLLKWCTALDREHNVD